MTHSLRPLALLTFLLLTSTLADSASSNEPVRLAVVLHKSNPAFRLSNSQVRAFCLGETREWPHRRRVTVVQRNPSRAVFQSVLRQVLKMSLAEYRRHALGVEFRGDEPLNVKLLDSDDAACNFVYNVPGAIAVLDQHVVSVSPCKDRVKVLVPDSAGFVGDM